MWIRSEVVVGKFKIHSEFRTHHGDFKFGTFPPLMSSKLIWNSPQFWIQPLVIEFWALKHTKNEFKCLHLIQNAFYSFRTHNI